MFGWPIAPAERASWWKRRTASFFRAWFGVQHLDRDRAPDGQVLGLEDRAHAAFAEHGAHHVLAADRLAEEIARRRFGRHRRRLVARRLADCSRAGASRRRPRRARSCRAGWPCRSTGRSLCVTSCGSPQCGQRMNLWLMRRPSSDATKATPLPEIMRAVPPRQRMTGRGAVHGQGGNRPRTGRHRAGLRRKTCGHEPGTRGARGAPSTRMHRSGRHRPSGGRGARGGSASPRRARRGRARPRRSSLLALLRAPGAGTGAHGGRRDRGDGRRARSRAGRAVVAPRGGARRGGCGARPAEALRGARAGSTRRRCARGTSCGGTRSSTASSCDGDPVDWSGDATLYGGPDDLARGDEADVVATLGRAAAPVERGRRATPARRRRTAASSAPGGRSTSSSVRRARGLFAWIDRVRGARARAASTRRSRRTSAPMARALVLGESDLAAGRRPGVPRQRAVPPARGLGDAPRARPRARGARRSRRCSCASRPWPRGIDVGRVAAAIGVPVAWLYAELAGAGGSTHPRRVDGDRGAPRPGPRAPHRRARARSGSRSAAMALLDPLVVVRPVVPALGGRDRGAARVRAAVRQRGSRRGCPRRLAPVARAAATTLAASVPCAPIIARFAPTRARSAGVLANLLAVPVGETVALPLCLAHAAARVVAGGRAGMRGRRDRARSFSCGPSRAASRCPRSRPTCRSPRPGSSRSLAVALAAFALGVRPRTTARVATGARCVLAARGRGARGPASRTGVLRATFLDVGQGDSAHRRPARRAGDGHRRRGPRRQPHRRRRARPRAGAPRAPARGRRASSCSPIRTRTTSAGSPTGLDAVRVGALWDTGQGEARGRRGRLRGAPRVASARAGVPVVRPDGLCGAHEHRRSARRGARAVPRRSTPTAARTTTRSSCGSPTASARFLFVGDAEHEEEAELLARRPRRACAPTCSRSVTTAAARRRRLRSSPRSQPQRGRHLGRLPQPLRPPAPADARRRSPPRASASGAPTTTARSPSRPTAARSTSTPRAAEIVDGRRRPL